MGNSTASRGTAIPLVQWARGEKPQEGVTFGIEDALMLTKMMEAAYKSYHSGKKEQVSGE